MPETKGFIKGFALLLVVLFFGLALTGCFDFAARSEQAALDESLEAELPGWMLLSYRSEVDPDLKEEINPEELFEGDDEGDIEELAPVVEPPTSSDSGGSSSSSSGSAGSSAASYTPQPGTREYMAWFAYNGAKGDYNPLYHEWYNETMGGSMPFSQWLEQKKQKEADEIGRSTGTPSGWGKDDGEDFLHLLN